MPLIPMVIERTARGEREFDIYSRLLNERIVFHQPSAGFEGQATDIQIHAQEILNVRQRIDEIYAHHTGQSVEQVHTDMERDRFFKPDEAVAYGLIDRVIEHH